ncbi:hypothetical protein D3C85_402230 [compost metagenome]
MRMALMIAVSPSEGMISLGCASPPASRGWIAAALPWTAAAPSASSAASFSGERLAT